ncbi:hypothetical protein S83_065530, partial [Arachis hypogaea]
MWFCSVLYIKCSPVEPIFVSAAASGGIGLLAAGQSSTITGTYAGQFITEGFLKLNIKKWLRSLITRSGAIVPTMIAAIVFNTSKSSLDTMNEWLNVVQSIQIPFALIPLLTLVSKEEVMGTFRIGPIIEESFVCIITFVELILMYTDYVCYHHLLHFFLVSAVTVAVQSGTRCQSRPSPGVAIRLFLPVVHSQYLSSLFESSPMPWYSVSPFILHFQSYNGASASVMNLVLLVMLPRQRKVKRMMKLKIFSRQ